MESDEWTGRENAEQGKVVRQSKATKASTVEA